jgi:hypothetical protein
VWKHANMGDPDESGIFLTAAAGIIENDDTAFVAAVAGIVPPVNWCRQGSATRLGEWNAAREVGELNLQAQGKWQEGVVPFVGLRKQGQWGA